MSKWTLVIIITTTSILILLVSIRIARILFVNDAEQRVISLFKNSEKESLTALEIEDIKHLPYPVQNWLIHSKVVGKEAIKTVRLKQEGRMRTKKDGPWMSVKAEQYFTVDEPGFVWIADVKMAPLLHLSGMDTYQAGKGKMNIKLLSLFSVVDSEGPEIDSATMMRYLVEMMWFPAGALSPYIKWQVMGQNNAKAKMEYKGVSVSAVFYFNENGDIIRIEGKRYREINGKYFLTDWGGRNIEFKEFEGIRIPSKSEVIWFEEDGEFIWFEVEINDLQYNNPSLY